MPEATLRVGQRHSGVRCPELRDALLLDIDEYLARTGCAESTLGQASMNNTRFVSSLRHDLKAIDSHRAAKIRRYMRHHRDGPGTGGPPPPQAPKRPVLERLENARQLMIGADLIPGSFYLSPDDWAALGLNVGGALAGVPFRRSTAAKPRSVLYSTTGRCVSVPPR